MKIKNLVYYAFAVMLMFPSEGHAQFLKKVGKALKDVDNTLKEVNDILGSKETSSVKTENDFIEVSEEAFVGESVSQRSNKPFRLTTNHPDFKVKVKRCEVSGKTCVIDLILENVGDSDVHIKVGRSWGMIAYDDDANQYVGGNQKGDIQIAVGNTSEWLWSGTIKLMAGVPIKARIQIEGVTESATMFRRLDVGIRSDEWNLNNENKKLIFYNLPISREGNEF